MNQEMAVTSVAADLCTHDEGYLDADTNQHLIECIQCSRWWRCYGDVQDVWMDFIRYWMMDGHHPATVQIRCSPTPRVPR